MIEGRIARLDDVCCVEYGTRVVQNRDGGTTYPVYGGGGATFNMDTFNREDRMVVGRFGMSPSCTRFVDGKFFLNDSGLTVSPRSASLVQAFLDYQMLSLNDEIYALGKGSAQKNLDVVAFRELPIFVPSGVADQARIVAILDEAFEGIAIAKVNAEQNVENARAVFDSRLNAVFRDHPPDWVAMPIGSICDIKHGYAFKGAEFSRSVPVGSPIVITPGNFSENGELVFSDSNTKRFSGIPPMGFEFDVGDLVVVMTDLSSKMKILGKPAFVESGNVLHNQRIGRVIFRNDSLDPRLLYYFMMTEGFLSNIRGSATGTMVRHTAPKRILGNGIAFPMERSEQRSLVGQLDSLRAEVGYLESVYLRRLDALDALKKSLLNEAFAGNL